MGTQIYFKYLCTRDDHHVKSKSSENANRYFWPDAVDCSRCLILTRCNSKLYITNRTLGPILQHSIYDWGIYIFLGVKNFHQNAIINNFDDITI